jgi:uncharacterized protein (TIGR04255 family)
MWPVEVGMLPGFPDYEKPPVIEVVCGITFEKLSGFKAPHFGIYWQRLRDDYPICQSAPPLGFPAGAIEDEKDFPLPLPRIWFISKDLSSVIQVQTNKFLCNWRKIEDETSYPRYDTIIKSFKKNLNVFKKFIKEENFDELNMIQCELSYINHIPQGKGWRSIDQIESLLPDLCWRTNEERFLPSPNKLEWTFSFDLPEGKGALNVKLNQAMRKRDNMPIFVLDLTARGTVAEQSAECLWDWFDVAHKWIVFGFADLTSREVQETVWKRVKG